LARQESSARELMFVRKLQAKKQPCGLGSRLRREAVGHPLGEKFDARLRPGTFASWRRGRHYCAADCPDAIVDGGGVFFDVIVTCQIERRAHAFDVSVGKERANVFLKARRYRHCASQVLDYADVAWNFRLELPLAPKA
jgi:hypothetical protein